MCRIVICVHNRRFNISSFSSHRCHKFLAFHPTGVSQSVGTQRNTLHIQCLRYTLALRRPTYSHFSPVSTAREMRHKHHPWARGVHSMYGPSLCLTQCVLQRTSALRTLALSYNRPLEIFHKADGEHRCLETSTLQMGGFLLAFYPKAGISNAVNHYSLEL